jgi:hypothetical protein
MVEKQIKVEILFADGYPLLAGQEREICSEFE